MPFVGTLLGPKMGLKWTKRALGGSLGRPGGARGGSGGPLEALGSPREAPWGLWGLKKIIENPLCFIVFLHYGGFRGSLGRPRGAQRDLRGGRGGPRGVQGRPKGDQGGSKERLWRRPKTVRKTEAAVSGRMVPFGSLLDPFGSLLDPFGKCGGYAGPGGGVRGG